MESEMSEEWADVVGFEWIRARRDCSEYVFKTKPRTVPAMCGSWKKVKGLVMRPDARGNYAIRNPKNATQTTYSGKALYDSAWVTGEPPLSVREEELIKRGESSL
jgi:hypothetical protein